MVDRRVLLGAVGGALVLALSALSAAALGTSPSAPKATSTGALTTYGYGVARSNDDTTQRAIHSLSTNPSWDASLDGAVYGQPLVYDGVAYVATEGDTVYALGATTGHVLWRVHIGNPVPVAVVDEAPTLSNGCGDIDPLGITGTPVIDTANNELYAAEETLYGGGHWQNIRHWLVAVSLTSHRELWRRSIDPPHANDPADYYIAAEQQRPALTLLGSRIYVEYGGLSGDCGTYHGYVVSVPVTSGGALLSYQVPTQREGGI